MLLVFFNGVITTNLKWFLTEHFMLPLWWVTLQRTSHLLYEYMAPMGNALLAKVRGAATQYCYCMTNSWELLSRTFIRQYYKHVALQAFDQPELVMPWKNFSVKVTPFLVSLKYRSPGSNIYQAAQLFNYTFLKPTSFEIKKWTEQNKRYIVMLIERFYT